MAEEMYVGINGKARKIVDAYIGVNGKARRITDIYAGINGVARQVFDFEYPVKGNIIVVDPNGAYKRGRVLSITGTRVKILCLSYETVTCSNPTTFGFDLSGKYYSKIAGYTNFKNALVAVFSNNYYIEKWYYNTGSLGSTAQGSPNYSLIKNGFFSPSVGYISTNSVTSSSSSNKYIQVASIRDIINYLGATTSMTASNTVLTPTNIFKVFDISSPSGTIWLQDIAADDTNKMMCVNSDRGFRSETFSGATKPIYYTFTVDLSKIGFKKISDS